MKRQTISLCSAWVLALSTACSHSTESPSETGTHAQSVSQNSTRAAVDGDFLTPANFIVPPGATGLDWRYRFGAAVDSWETPSFDDSSWSVGKGGIYEGSSSADDSLTTHWPAGSSNLWARSTFTVSESELDGLMLWGRWDDEIRIYINGHEASFMKSWANSYRYVGLSAEARASLVAGQPNTIAVHVLDHGGGRYMDLGLANVPELVNMPITGPALTPELQAVTEYVREEMQKHGVTAGSIAIGRGAGSAEIVVNQAIGYMDKQFTEPVPPDAVFRLASLDKIPTKDAIHKMIADGVTNTNTGQELSYSTLVFPLIQSFGVLNGLTPTDTSVNNITIQHLLDHLGGTRELGTAEDIYAALGIPEGTSTLEDNARYMFIQPLLREPGTVVDGAYSSSGYMLLRYVVHLLSGDLESYLQNELFAGTGSTDIFVSGERLLDRVAYSNGELREPWYTTFETPYDRWLYLDNYTALSTSMEAYTRYQLHLPGAGLFYGGMAGTQSATQKLLLPSGETASYTVAFNLCCAIPTRETEEDGTIITANLDGTIQQMLQALPPSAWGDSDSGNLTMEKWLDVPGMELSDIPVSTTPDYQAGINTFEIPSHTGDNYGVRVRGYVTAPETGNYSFWIAGDDQVALYLSTDDSEENKVQIAGHTGWTNNREWNKYPSQQSVEVSLVAGQRYYIEALMKEGTGGDSLAVGWLKPSESGVAPSGVIPGTVLTPFVELAAPTCSDSIQNGTESDVDCGGDTCAPCIDNSSCGSNSDCESGFCDELVCTTPAVPTCDDGLQNGNETGVDCGGDCTACNTGSTCTCPAGCDQVQTASLPFTASGTQNACYFIDGALGSYINSWSNSAVNVNGTDITNTYVQSQNYPAQIDGGYYLYVDSSAPWSQVESR